MASFKIAIARPGVHAPRKSIRSAVTKCDVLQAKTTKVQAQGDLVAPEQ